MIDVDSIRNEICKSFCRDVLIEPFSGNARADNGDVQLAVHLPLVGRDGDGIVAYLSQTVTGWRLSDNGMTLMRLSYENDLGRLLSGARERLFRTVLSESHLQQDNGELFIEVPADSLMRGLLLLGQGCIRVEDMGLWTRTKVESAFNDDLRRALHRLLPSDDCVENFQVPNVPDAATYPVDYFIKTPGKPLYLFGVHNKDRARLVTIILQYLTAHASIFDSMVVYSELNDVPEADSRRLLAAANDIVPSINETAILEQKIRHRRAA
jgi:hypothetical protein